MSAMTLDERLRWYEQLLMLSRRMQDESLESVCRYLMDDSIAAAKAEAGYFFFFDRNDKPKIAFARSGVRDDIPRSDQVYSESIIRRAVEMQSPVIIDDALAHPEFRDAKSVIAGNLKSVLAVPFFYNKKAIGLIYLENRNQTQYFAPELLELLNVFSTHAAVLLHTKLSEAHKLKTSIEESLESKSPQMVKVLQMVDMAAKTDSPILVLGETGTGKEVLANRIHKSSQRASGQFVALNCSAIPETLIEAELFGYKKGAFTGAVADREGLVKKANKGTLFLDEIGDLALHMQVKLLRVIQEKKFTRLGSTAEEESDFRVICATHQPLNERVDKGFFRQDLFFRINTITLQLPPLRHRLEDLIGLAELFVEEAATESKKEINGIDESARSTLLDFDWPGNIRQLKNAIQRAVAMAPDSGHLLTKSDFDFLDSKKSAQGDLPSLHEAKENFIRNYVKKAILIHKGNKTKAAKALGVDPKTLYRHLLEGEED